MIRGHMRFLLLPILSAMLWAQPPASEAPPPPPPAAGAPPQRRIPEPKNLQVLKVQPQELIGVMRNWSASLGVQCNYCHVQGNFASDDKPTKLLARKMYTMVTDVNTHYAEAKVNIGCYTCHRGKTEPEVNPPAPPAGEGQRPAAAPPPPPPPPQ